MTAMDSEQGRSEASWEDLARRTRRHALIYGRARVIPSGGRVEIRPGRHQTVGVLLLGLLGVAVLLAAMQAWRLDDPLFIGSAVVCALIGAGLLMVTVAGALRRVRLSWEQVGEILSLTFGTFPFVTTLELSRGLLRARLAPVLNDDADSQAQTGKAIFTLERMDRPGGVRIAVGTRAELFPAFHEIGSFLEGRAIDQTLQAIQRHEQHFTVPVSPAGSGAANFVSAELKRYSPDLAILRPSGAARAFFGSFLAGSLLIGVPLVYVAAAEDSTWGVAFTGGLTFILGAAALVGLWPGFQIRQATFDRSRQLATIHGGIGVGFLGRRQFPFDMIAAVQICARHVDSENPYTTFELNLVLLDPPGHRLTLVSHADAGRIREDARLLAKLIGTQLLDHAMEADQKCDRQ